MAGEQSTPNRELNLPDESRASQLEPEYQSTASHEYEALLHRYGEAIRQIDRLMEEVDRLTRRLEGVPTGSAPGTKITINVEDLTGILNRLKGIGERSDASTKNAYRNDSDLDTGPATSMNRTHLQQGDPATAQLRLQINALASQLARAEAQLSEMNGHLDAIGRTVGLIQEHLLRDSKP